MSGIIFLFRNGFLPSGKAVIVLFLALMLTGCASKMNRVPNNIAELGLTKNGVVLGSQQDFAQNVSDKIFFDTDSSVIRPNSANILNQQITWLNQYPNKIITIEGHADERGTREYNLALGARRAEATREYLVSHGLSPSRIRTLSFGKERPIAVCDDVSCWAQNRRAVTVLDAMDR